MAPRHEEVAHDLGDGWTAVWDATDIPADVSKAFEVGRESGDESFAMTAEGAAQSDSGRAAEQ